MELIVFAIKVFILSMELALNVIQHVEHALVKALIIALVAQM
jgi:hypothetical protein